VTCAKCGLHYVTKRVPRMRCRCYQHCPCRGLCKVGCPCEPLADKRKAR